MKNDDYNIVHLEARCEIRREFWTLKFLKKKKYEKNTKAQRFIK